MNVALRTPTTALALTVNGRPVSAHVEPRTHLADFIRETLDLTGTHLGCEHGVCGACTVLLDGEPARACISFAAACDGADVVTIEGLDHDEITSELRAAFNREHALQCGFCTPGMLIAARDLVLRLPDADERRIRLGLSGNLCRCTGYVGIVRAIMGVIADQRGRGIAPLVSADRKIGPVGARQGAATPLAARSFGALEPAVTVNRDVLSGAFTPAHSFSQSFEIPFPPAEVFAFFGRVEDVAACLPGAMVTAIPSPDRVEGGMRVRLGPISATFRGAAVISRDEPARSGRIRGAGADGRSSTQGQIDYRVLPGAAGGSSRVELAVGYALKGPLAQFGRPGLVRDVAGRLVAEFSNNLEARLVGGATAPARELDPLRLALGLLRARIARWLARLRRRGGAPPGGS